MRLSKAARNKWLAACLFSATVLTGFHLQQMAVHASETQNTTAVTSTTDATTTSSTHSVSLKSSSSVTTTTSSNSQSNSSSSSQSSSNSSSSSSTSISSTNDSKTSSVISNSVGESSSSAPENGSNQNKETDNTATNQLGHLVVNAFNAVTNEKINGDAFTSHYQGYVGSAIKDKSAFVTRIPGYSFVGNADTAIPDNFIGGTQIANLYYKPFSTIVVRYVAEPNRLLWTYSIPTTYATQGQLFSTTDNLIPFAGYKLDHVSGDVNGIINQTVNSLSDANPVVITYYYQPESGSTSTLDTSNWIVTSKTTPIGATGKYSFNMYLQRDQLPPIEIGHYGIQPTGSNQIRTNGGTTGTDSVIEKETTGSATTTDINTQTPTKPVSLPTAPSVPTATVNIVTETGKPINQLTVSGQPGTNVRTQIQPELNNLRRQGFAILSNGVKGDTKLGPDNSVLTVKVSQPDQQTDPFQHSTMPIIAQLGQASQPVSHTQATQTASNAQNSNHTQRSENTNHTTQQNSQKHQQIIRTHTTEATSKDTERNSQVHRDTIANLGQSHQHSAAATGSGGNQVSGLAAYFISLSGKINLGTRV